MSAPPTLTHTLAMVKPDAVEHTDAIIEMAAAKGFTVLAQKRVQLTPEKTSEFYAEHQGKPFFPTLVSFMSSGPLVAIVFARADAVAEWRALIGPTNSAVARTDKPHSVRALFGTDNTRNAVHGSDSAASAQREANFFFPDSALALTSGHNLTAATVQNQAAPSAFEDAEFLNKSVHPTLQKGLAALAKAKPADPLRWLSTWLADNNPNTPKVLLS